MKRWIALVCSLCLLMTVAACGNKVDTIPVKKANADILVVYYSDSDIMEHVAQAIADKTGGKLIEVHRQVPFPKDMKDAMDAAREEAVNHTLPPIATKVVDANQYKTVFLCYPIWWGTLPMPVYTFLQETNLSGVSVVPVAGSVKGTMEQSVADLKQQSTGAQVKEGYFINSPESAQGIGGWLEEHGYAEQTVNSRQKDSRPSVCCLFV